MNALAVAITVVAVAREQAIAHGPGQPAQFLYHDLVLGAPVKFSFGAEAEALVEVLVSGIDGNHQCPIFVSAAEGAVRVGCDDFGRDGHGDMNDHGSAPICSGSYDRGAGWLLRSIFSSGLALMLSRLCGT